MWEVGASPQIPIYTLTHTHSHTHSHTLTHLQAWNCFLEVSDTIQKQISSGSAQMSGVILQSIDQLIRDKRGAKKVCEPWGRE